MSKIGRSIAEGVSWLNLFDSHETNIILQYVTRSCRTLAVGASDEQGSLCEGLLAVLSFDLYQIA